LAAFVISLLAFRTVGAINADAYNAWWKSQAIGSPVQAPEVDCDWVLPDAGLVRKSYTVVCPSNCLDVNHCVHVKGAGTYTAHSPVCLAAIHAGAIQEGTGGGVLVTIAEGQPRYVAAFKNGVQSIPHGPYFSSFSVKKTDVDCKTKPTVAPTTAPCFDRAFLDLVFVADSSLSVGPNDFKLEMQFISDIAGMFHISPSQARVGLVTFNTFPKTRFNMQKYKNKASLQSALKRVSYQTGGTYIGKALYEVSRKMHFRMDKKVEKIVIVFTDGRSMDRVDRPIKELKKKNVEMIAFGVGDVKYKTLHEIADKKENVYTAKNFGDLKNYLNSLVTRICSFVMQGR